jgi:hypothetical protein
MMPQSQNDARFTVAESMQWWRTWLFFKNCRKLNGPINRNAVRRDIAIINEEFRISLTKNGEFLEIG